MTILADITDFQANGCNTYERLIIRCSQMLLYLQNAQQDNENYPYKERVLLAVSWSRTEPRVVVEITFALKNTALEQNGLFSVLPFQPAEAFVLEPLDAPPAELYAAPFPDWVTDVENCVVWAGLSLNRPENVTFKPDYKKEELTFTASLPLDIDLLQRTGGDLIASSRRINSDIPDYFA